MSPAVVHPLLRFHHNHVSCSHICHIFYLMKMMQLTTHLLCICVCVYIHECAYKCVSNHIYGGQMLMCGISLVALSLCLSLDLLDWLVSEFLLSLPLPTSTETSEESPQFLCGCWDPKANLQASTAGVLPTKSPPQL